ncbi:MAG TPA: CAP domain-containing protein [Mycobacteriales bacterium]|nr:CAP domain-containing protein [Mycobacteriales bacterium]
MTISRISARSVARQLATLFAVVAVLLGFALAPAAHAGPGEGDFFSRTNSARASYRLRGYVSKADLVTVARRHAQRMASQNRLYHNPNLGREVTGWRMVGENVGRGTTVAAIHNAFMNSAAHRSNILDRDFTEVGMGTYRDAKGVIWVVEVFRRP